jgi:hypothetical protein
MQLLEFDKHMRFTIYQWSQIEHLYKGALILGNGASIKFSNKFDYTSLKANAESNGILDPLSQKVFQCLDSVDYEQILHSLHQAERLNKTLGVKENATRETYNKIKTGLIEVVRNVHPQHEELLFELASFSKFMHKFHTICSLNYDLIMYWCALLSNDVDDGHQFKDCFYNQRGSGKFSPDWREWRKQYNYHDRKLRTLLFYPHGNLILFRDEFLGEGKVFVNDGKLLLESILSNWDRHDCVPLFVAEGTSEQKMASIGNSPYLRTVYNEVIPSLGTDLTIFGWGLWDQDKHILKAISKANIRTVAVSVYKFDEDYCRRVTKLIKSYLPNINIDFFDSESI